jgi:hypothetical protein
MINWEMVVAFTCAGYLVHPFGKADHERGECMLPLSHCLVCGDQETGRRSRETEPEEQTESQSSSARRCCASKGVRERSPHAIIPVMIQS